MSPPVATREQTTASTSTATGDRAPEAVPVLTTVPRPIGDASVVTVTGLAGGLQAVQAEWGVDGGAVVLSGQAPFTELTGHAGFRSDGSLDGTVRMQATVGLLGLDLGEATWTVDGWTPEMTLAVPGVALRGTTLAIDLRELPPGTAFTAREGVDAPRTDTGATIHLPQDAVPAGEPLSPRLVEVYRGLLGVDLAADPHRLEVHADAAVAGVPAFVTDGHLFLAPGIYGVDAPEPLRMLDAAIRAAVAGLVGAVAGPPAPVDRPPAAASAPAAATDLVPADVPPVPTAEAAPAEATPAEGAAGAAPTEAAPADVAPAAEEAPPEAAPEEAPPPVELIMPEPPTALTRAAAARGGGVAGGAGGAARAARDLPSADADVADARGAVTEPVAETAARAREELAAELGERPAPSPEIVALCERIRTAIRENRPEDEDKLLETDPTQEAQNAGATITGSVEGQVDQVSSSYDAMATPPTGTPALTPTPVVAPSPTSPGMGVDAASAAPDPIPPENTSLDADVAATDQRIADSGIDTRVTREIPDGPFAEARAARGELGEAAERTPQQIQAEQQQAIESAQGDMAALQQQAVAAMRSARSGTVETVGGGQQGAVTTEQNTREAVSQRAQGIYDNAQRQVDALLQPLSRTAIARWEAGLTQLSQTFHDALHRVQLWIEDRHSGVGGTILAIGDYIGGLPDWVTDEYNRAEREFGDGVTTLLTDISSDVNGVIAAAQALIQHARTDIDAAFTAMEAEFPEWAAQERARFGGMLDGLSQRVTAAQTSFVRDVSARAITAVNDVHAEAQALRDAAGGLIGRVVAAIEEFIDDPVRAIINGLLRLVGIPPSAFWALIAKIEQVISDIADDPENFINNLTAGVKQGFEQFFDNFGTHVLHGFWDWLFSGLETPIPMPRDFSARSLFGFALDLMGITWPRIREILVRHIGPTAVEVIEAAWQLISVLIERGPDGIVELIKEQLSPENIVGMILEAAVEYLTQTLIEQVIVRVVGMLNPVGAIAQAIDLIYQVCSWIFRNAARIFRFVEAIVNGMADVIAGNIGGLANAVERALASLIPPVIDFLAGLLHLGGLPGEVADVITRLQTMVYGVLDRVIGWLAERGRALLRRMGIGGDEEPGEGHNGDDELGKTVRFSADGHSHRLWFQVAGDDATLMVASVPKPIADQIAEWRTKVDDLPEEHKATAPGKLDALTTVADQASVEGDQLAHAFNEANRDKTDTNEPPDDTALEGREQAIAGMMNELFEIFGRTGSEAEQLADIAANLPAHGRARADAMFRIWESRYLAHATHIPTGTETAVPIWAAGAVSDPALRAGLAYLAQESVHRQLLPYLQEGSGRRSAGTGAFRAYALSDASAPHPVRTEFASAVGNAYADAFRANPPQGLDPVDTQLPATVASIAYTPGSPAPYGGFNPFPGREDPDPALVTAAGGDFKAFLLGIAQSATYNGFTRARMNWAWTHPPSKTWIEGRFRQPRMHEWIPTNLLPTLLRAAFDARDAAGLKLAVKWLVFQYALRSETSHVLWHFDPNPAGHVGAFTRTDDGHDHYGTALSDEFHDWLRQTYAQQRDAGPYAFSIAIMQRIEQWVWNGRLTGIPAANVEDQITVWYHVQGVGRVAGLTFGDLGALQSGNYIEIIRNFESALDAVSWE
ncbi:hypothetical protein [Nocardioides conyzicola]|uniref:Uncharacterized protein n=1 Tax=Nocardioides conyzicola TaxID=1651781 RepID=A0ABP8XY07_9ACTN